MSWRNSAACRGMDPGLFYGVRGGAVPREVTAACASCPVRAECLEWALRTGDDFAYLGGTTPGQRRDMRRRSLMREGAVA